MVTGADISTPASPNELLWRVVASISARLSPAPAPTPVTVIGWPRSMTLPEAAVIVGTTVKGANWVSPVSEPTARISWLPPAMTGTAKLLAKAPLTDRSWATSCDPTNTSTTSDAPNVQLPGRTARIVPTGPRLIGTPGEPQSRSEAPIVNTSVARAPAPIVRSLPT